LTYINIGSSPSLSCSEEFEVISDFTDLTLACHLVLTGIGKGKVVSVLD